MQVESVSKKYAKAFFLLAEKADATEAVRADLESLVGLLRRAPTLLSFLQSPDVTQETKLTLLGTAVKSRVQDSTWLFLRLLTKRKRLPLLPQIFSAYVGMDEARKGIRRVRVVSAVPLEKHERELLTSRLEQITGNKVLMDATVDPSIIGGVVVYLNGKVIDGSIRSGLEDLRERLLAAAVF
ncbi:MAG: ATP synthase F1 subunit delta [Candidatus Eisenbacteria bacterium]